MVFSSLILLLSGLITPFFFIITNANAITLAFFSITISCASIITRSKFSLEAYSPSIYLTPDLLPVFLFFS